MILFSKFLVNVRLGGGLKTSAAFEAYPQNIIINSCPLFSISISLKSLQRQGHEIIFIWALQLDRIAFPPREISSKLKDRKDGENIVVEKPA
jgi:hypothetical protein